ncbi:MAG TPA: hypothetical protein VMD49_07455 [Steroidobacteraceae bacterium]|nr:hypothetical protein [Steroidobacteraceae bacterium]
MSRADPSAAERGGVVDEMGAEAIQGVRLRARLIEIANLYFDGIEHSDGARVPDAHIEALRARRFPVVDEARGLAVCHVMFDHPGDRERADGTYPFRSPNSMLAFEVFKVRRGVLEEVWAIGTALPYGIDSGWSP